MSSTPSSSEFMGLEFFRFEEYVAQIAKYSKSDDE
jgi:hypothetical protein